jgi:fatty acid desaturase
MSTASPAHVGSRERPPRSLYSEVLADVRAAGLMNRRLDAYAVHFAVNTVGVVAVVTALVVWHHSRWSAALAVVLAVVSVQIGFLGHDVAHRQVSRHARTCTVLGLLLANLLSGLSYGWWVDKHNAHHAHPNDLDSDPDVRPGVIVFDVSHARPRHGWSAVVTRYQA